MRSYESTEAALAATRVRYRRMKRLLMDLYGLSGVSVSLVQKRMFVLSMPGASPILSELTLGGLSSWPTGRVHHHRTLRSTLLTRALTLYRSSRIPKGK